MTAAIPPKLPSAARHKLRGRAGFVAAARSEFTKLRSVRSTYWTLLTMFAVCVLLGGLFSWAQVQALANVPPGALAYEAAGIRATAASTSLAGLVAGQLVIIVLGALSVTSEYTTGMIRTSLTVMPRRWTLFAAKGTVVGLVALVTGLITSFAAFLTGQAIMSIRHVNTGLGQPEVLRTVVGGGLFLAVCGLLAFGIGAMLRYTSGAITAGIGLMFVVWILSNFLPSPPSGWFGKADISKWIPLNAGSAIWQSPGSNGIHSFSPWAGFAVFCGYAMIAVLGGLIVFLHHDA